jgi:steroid delta-isomerase-like uncharacterized protein
MSGEGNKDVVRRFNQAMRRFWQTGDADALEGLLAPDFQQHWPGFPSDRPGYVQTLREFRTAFPDLEKTTEDMFAEGEKVLDRVSVRCTHTGAFRGQPATGRQIVLSEMHVARVLNGQIIERWGEWDQLGLLQQVGMIDVSSSSGA